MATDVGEAVDTTEDFRRRILRDSVFRPFLVAQIVSVAGNWAHVVGVTIVARDLTDSTVLVALAVAIRQLPILLLSKLSGDLLRRRERLIQLAGAQLIAAAVTAVMALVIGLNTASIWLLIGLNGMLGVLHSLENPGKLAALSDIFDDAALPAAVGVQNSAMMLARMIGPAVTAAFLAIGPTWLVFALNTATFVGGAALTMVARQRLSGRSVASASHPASGGGRRVSLRDLTRDPTLRAVLLLVAAVALTAFDSYVVLAELIRDELGASETTFSGAMAVLGGASVIGAASVGGRRLSASLSTLRVSILVLAAAFVGVTMTGSIGPVMILVAVAGLAGGVILSASGGLVQVAAAKEIRPSVVAYYAAALIGLGPICMVLSGAMSDVFGPRTTYVALAAVLSTAVVVSHVTTPPPMVGSASNEMKSQVT